MLTIFRDSSLPQSVATLIQGACHAHRVGSPAGATRDHCPSRTSACHAGHQFLQQSFRGSAAVSSTQQMKKWSYVFQDLKPGLDQPAPRVLYLLASSRSLIPNHSFLMMTLALSHPRIQLTTSGHTLKATKLLGTHFLLEHPPG